MDHSNGALAARAGGQLHWPGAVIHYRQAARVTGLAKHTAALSLMQADLNSGREAQIEAGSGSRLNYNSNHFESFYWIRRTKNRFIYTIIFDHEDIIAYS